MFIFALCFFPEHNASASDTQRVNNEAAALRKKATASQYFIRSTSFSHDEDATKGKGGDAFSASYTSCTGVPLTYYTEGKIGTVAVSGVDGISLGDLVITKDNRCFLAIDTGGALKSKTASRKLARLYGYTDDAHINAPVVDFFIRGCAQVGDEWDIVTVIHNRDDFMSLSYKERARYLDPSVWESMLAHAGITTNGTRLLVMQ